MRSKDESVSLQGVTTVVKNKLLGSDVVILALEGVFALFEVIILANVLFSNPLLRKD